jgi:hypothetical protein
MYTSTEQAPAPTCGVCGRKLGVGFYFSCHICGRTFCYAHAPLKCSHEPLERIQQTSQTKIIR